MNTGKIIQSEEEITEILQIYRTVAVVGLSPKPERDSYRVAEYLLDHGYHVIPIRPAQQVILEQRAYGTLDELEEPVDIVDVFRSADKIMPHVEEALRIKPKVFWMQLGIENREAADILTKAGIDVVMDRCIKVEHEKRFG